MTCPGDPTMMSGSDSKADTSPKPSSAAAKSSVVTCAACGKPGLPSGSFSKAQLKKSADVRRCKDCVAAGVDVGDGPPSTESAQRGMSEEGVERREVENCGDGGEDGAGQSGGGSDGADERAKDAEIAEQDEGSANDEPNLSTRSAELPSTGSSAEGDPSDAAAGNEANALSDAEVVGSASTEAGTPATTIPTAEMSAAVPSEPADPVDQASGSPDGSVRSEIHKDSADSVEKKMEEETPDANAETSDVGPQPDASAPGESASLDEATESIDGAVENSEAGVTNASTLALNKSTHTAAHDKASETPANNDAVEADAPKEDDEEGGSADIESNAEESPLDTETSGVGTQSTLSPKESTSLDDGPAVPPDEDSEALGHDETVKAPFIDKVDDEDHEEGADVEFDLCFTDYVDMQTRLVLVPLNDNACTGAVIDSYAPPTAERVVDRLSVDEDKSDTAMQDDSELEGMEDVTLEDGTAKKNVDAHHHHGEEEKKTEVSDASPRRDDGVPTAAAAKAPPTSDIIVGSVLIGVPSLTGENGEEEDDDWTAVDLTFILSAIRGTPTPIVMRFRHRSPFAASRSAEGEHAVNGLRREMASNAIASKSTSAELSSRADEAPVLKEDHAAGEREEPQKSSKSSTEANSGSTSALLSSRLSRWGSRASSLAAEAKERARVAMEEAEKLVAERAAAKLAVASSSSGDAEEIKIEGDKDVTGGAESEKAEVGGEEKPPAQTWSDGRPPLVPILSVDRETSDPPSDGKCRDNCEDAMPEDVTLPSSPPLEGTESEVAQVAEEQGSNSTAHNCHSGSSSSPQSPPSLATKMRLLQSPVQSENFTRPPTWDQVGLDNPPCGLFLQAASGGFVRLEMDSDGFAADTLLSPSIFGSSTVDPTLSPVRMRRTMSGNSIASVGSTPSRKGGTVSSASSVASRKKLARLYPVSNASVLLVRASSDRPCPAKGYSYQWYRSAGSADDERSDGSGAGADSDSYCSLDMGSDADAVAGWYALPGATYAAFQPSATDVGHRVRCVVTVEQQGGVQSDGSAKDKFSVICELPYPIVADSGLFNAARQNFSGKKGGLFSNLKGRGNAEGRVFRLQIAPSESGSRMRIFQVSGSTAEPIHSIQEPILNASAVSAAAEPKAFEIIFPSGLPPSGQMVKALCTDSGSFQLKAPNRMTRESLLLALGIANHYGRSDLNVDSVLFPRIPPGVVVESDGAVALDVFMRGNQGEADCVTAQKNEDGRNDANRYKEQDHIPSNSTEIKREEQNHIPSTPQPFLSPKTPGPQDSVAASDEQFQALEDQLRSMLEKLFAKEKAVSDLQRSITQSESARTRAESNLATLRSETNMSKAQYKECRKALRSAEKKIEMRESAINRMKGEYDSRVSSLEDRIKHDEKKNAEYEKIIKALQNEKAVLSAAVEARDGKLSKMEQLQLTVESLKSEVAKGQEVQKQLINMTANYNATRTELENAKSSEEKCGEEVRYLKKTLEKMQHGVEEEKKLAAKCKSQMENANAKCQKLKAERNAYKQRADSLSKEMSRVCKNGMGVGEIEQITQEHEALKMEVSLLKTQKRKAMDELEESRRLHERSLEAQEKAGVDEEVMRALEQRAELERVVSNLTEYVSAKEMQLETMMEVNKTLQNELHLLAQSKMGKDEV